MKNRIGLAACLCLLLCQLPTPQAVAQSSVPPSVPSGLTFGSGAQKGENMLLPDSGGGDVCDPKPLPQVQAVPSMAPLKDDVSARVDYRVGRDGQLVAARIGDSSGDAARDAALLAHVLGTWRFEPLRKGCEISPMMQSRVHFPHITCAPQPLPETQSTPDVELQERPRSVELSVAVMPDGSVASAGVIRSSGDATLDAAAVAQVKAVWRWQPYVCPAAKPPVTGTATVNFPYVTN